MNKGFENEFKKRLYVALEDAVIDRLIDSTLGMLERDHKFFTENPKISELQQSAIKYILKNYKEGEI